MVRAHHLSTWARMGVGAIVFLLVFAFRSCGPVRAEPCVKSHPMKVGSVATCDGDLMPTDKLGKLLLDQTALGLAKTQLAECQAESKRKVKTCQDRAGVDLAQCQSDRDTESLARRSCEESRTIPVGEVVSWYERPWFVATATAVVVTAVVVAVATALR